MVLAGAEADKRDLLLEIIAGAEFSSEKNLFFGEVAGRVGG